MFEEADIADIFRGGLPYYLLLALPCLIICSATPVLAASEFSVQRMSQFDVNGISYGCRASALSLEAKSLYTWTTARHCVVAKFLDLTIGQFNDIRQKAGGLVVLLPKNIAALDSNKKEHLANLEQAMLTQPTSIPVYFSQYNSDLEQVIVDITRTSDTNTNIIQNSDSVERIRQSSALSELFTSISANGYQVIVSGATHTANKNSKIYVVQGELSTSSSKYIKQLEGTVDLNSKLPLIILTAHLNTFGLYNDYPVNADAAVLLTLADVFSKLHNTPNATPKFRLMFILSEAGTLLNFQGAKKWLDENVQLQNVAFVLCLDTVTSGLNSDSSSLFMHVSKPPKEDSSMNNFYKLLKLVGAQQDNITLDGVHKKINLADQQLAWEHERFSMKRMPAFTLSALKSPREPVRTTIFRESDSQILSQTQKMAKVIAEALALYIYNIDETGEIFSDTININKDMVKAFLNLKSALHNNDLKNAFEKYLKNVKIIYDKPDAREPDFMLYDGHSANLNVYRVKPAVFDLFLTVLICIYLAIVYILIQHFPRVYDVVCKMTKSPAQSHIVNHTEKSKSKLA